MCPLNSKDQYTWLGKTVSSLGIIVRMDNYRLITKSRNRGKPQLLLVTMS